MTEPMPYEFSADQNQLLSRLAYKMRGVGVVYVVLGVLSLLFGGLMAVAVATDPKFATDPKLAENKLTIWSVAGFYAVSGLINLAIGVWTVGAGRAFRRIVDTQGSDMPLLMGALDTLHKVYSLLYTVILIGLIVFLALIGVGIVGAYVGKG